MSRLIVDWAVIHRARNNLRSIGSVFSKPSRAMASLDARAVGVDNLERTLDRFGDEWSYGVKQLQKFCENAADALDSVETAFKKADDDLAKALKQAAAK